LRSIPCVNDTRNRSHAPKHDPAPDHTKRKIKYACAPGDRQRVKSEVSNSEGIANQTGPESCVAHREVRDEALTGEPAGQPLSPEIETPRSEEHTSELQSHLH